MKTHRKITLGALNIVTHPHSPEDYEKLFLHAGELRQIIKIWGDTHGLMRMAYKVEDSTTPIITGEIFTFLHIDINQPWFDILKGEQATDKQTKEVHIPDNLKPHLKKIRFAFFPKTHVFVFTLFDSLHGNISPERMRYFLLRLLNDNRIIDAARFPEVDVRFIQDSKDLDWMFQHLRVHSLDICISRPNDDTGGKAGESIEEELEDQNIEEYFVSQKAKKGQAIKPNKRTKRLMHEATQNGYVQAKGYDEDDKLKTVNTTETPIQEQVFIHTKRPYLEAVFDAAIELVRKIKGH